MSPNDPLKHIIYITLPDEAARRIDSFTLDPAIALPVEIPPGKDAVDLGELSWEMIVSGMLKIFAYQSDHQDLDYYRRFINAVQPNLTAELTQAGIAKAEARDYELAEEIFKALRHLSPDEENTFLNLALLYEQQLSEVVGSGNSEREQYLWNLAHGTYQELTETHSTSPLCRYRAGLFYLRLEHIKRAKEHFEAYIRLDPEGEHAQQVRGMLHDMAGREEDEHMIASAFDHMRLGQEEQALELIENYLTSNGDIWTGWFIKGWALRRLGRFDQGETALKKSVAFAPDQCDVFNELAICLMEQGKYKESREYLEKALALEPENVKIISNFGVLAMKAGNMEEAASFFRAAHEFDPDDPVARYYLEEVFHE